MYNNGFPASYTPFYTPMQAPQQNTAPVQGGRIWVQGEAGARSYLVAPNNTVELWDSESQTIYLKSADASGMPSIKTLDYTIRENAPEGNTTAVYATKGDIDAINDDIKAIKKRIEKLMKEDADE